MNQTRAKLQSLSLNREEVGGAPSPFEWLNLEMGRTRVGKMRVQSQSRVLTIYSIQIFPEYQGQGLAKRILATLKSRYAVLVADRVRPAAREFWKKMGFLEDEMGKFVFRLKDSCS